MSAGVNGSDLDFEIVSLWERQKRDTSPIAQDARDLASPMFLRNWKAEAEAANRRLRRMEWLAAAILAALIGLAVAMAFRAWGAPP